MMGGKTPETCWTLNIRQDNGLKYCCVKLVIYLNCKMMHGLTNFKFMNFYLISLWSRRACCLQFERH
jgi:hypothetical protein